MQSINPKATLLALFIGLMIFSNHLLANVNVLIIGSTHDSSEQRGGSSKPFSPTAIGTQLQSILAGSGLGTVNVVVTDRYATASTVMGSSTYAFNLASWYHWPFPKGAESARWANLRGEAGTVWDYVILIPDPYTVEYTPGLTALGAAEIAEEVAKGSAETILLMPWPASGSSRNIAHYKDVVYRAGRSGGIKVAPGGLAWQAIKGAALTNPNPNADGAFIAAASIYSTIYNQSAAASTYVYNDTWANTVNTTEANNRNAQQYTGGFSFQNPYLFRSDYKRKIYYSSRGTSTESYFQGAVNAAIGRSKVSVAVSCPWNRSETDWTNNGGDQPWTKWPADFVPPIAWNHGRDGVTAEWYKSYLVNPTYWDFAYGYEYHANTWSQPVEDANDHFVSMMLPQDNMLAHRMMSEGNSARNLPVRTLWAQIHKEFPSENPLMDGSGPHMNQLEHEAVGTYMYTLYSGRCPLDPKPATLDKTWVARKIGYETAWRLGRCQMRAPGFKVMPSAATKTSITSGTTETMSVQFILPPKQDVTVNVSISNANAAIVGSQKLVFTPQNHNVPQNVVVAGLAGSAASETFSVVFNTVSTDEVYNALSDTWDYTITRSAPVTLTRVNKTASQVNAYQNLPVTINLNTTNAISTNTILAGPSHGVASWSGSNVIYTPGSDFLGKDGFSFATNNAGTLSVGYVEITVTSAAVNGMVSYRGNSSDGGTAPVDSATYAQNASVTVLGNSGNLIKVGYNFAGWNTAANGSGTNYAAGATFSMGASGMILYAKWTSVPTYTVTYNGNANTAGSVPYNQTKTDGVNLTLATNIGTLARTGYTFSGWNTAADGTGTAYAANATYSGNADLTLYAKWTLVTYAVNYNANSATSGTAPANQTKTYGVNLTLQTNSGNLARAGYIFAGWNNQAAGTGTNYAVGANYTANAGVTLYAKWTPGTAYTVSYNANGATSGTVPADQTKQTDLTLTLATNTGVLARTGFTFAGWNTAADGSGTTYAAGASYTANATAVLYAQWAGTVTYTVSYNGNGNTGGMAPSNQTKTQGVGLTLATNTENLTKTGYAFAGWNTLANGSGTAYAAGAVYTADSAATLYAQWNAPPVVNAGANQTVTLSGTAWSPAHLTPQLWLDADDASTITLNGATVSEWRDKSGNARHAAQTTAASQPTKTAAALNGKSVLTFDGTTDFLNLGTGLDFLSGVSHSAFVVTKPTSFNNIYGAANASAGANSLHVGFNGTNYRMNYWGNDYAPARTANFVAGSANIVNYIWTSGTNKEILANGKSEATASTTGVIGTMSGGGRIGNIVGQGYIGGDIAEMVFLTGTVSAANRESMEGYLAHKWGMTANLATAHPYKNSAPGGAGAVATLDATATDADPLTCSWSVVSGPASVSFANPATIDTSATFTVAGVYTLRLTANDGISSVSSDIVITVNLPDAGYTVTYNANSATSGTTPAAQTKTHDVSLTLQNNTGNLARTGYSFAGWNTLANGSGTDYAEGATYTTNAALTLYAKWTMLPYTAWASSNSLYGGNALSTANPDGDNLTNFQEFAFGMDPTSPILAPLSYVANGTTTGGTPVLEKQGATYRAVFARRKNYIAAGITYTVTFSADLIQWTENTLAPLPVRRSGDNADTMEAVSIDFPGSVFLQVGGSAPPRFFRVAVTGN